MYTINVSKEQAEIILNSLAQQPYIQVAGLINELTQQLNSPQQNTRVTEEPSLKE
jgi:hypothetical protein